MSYQFPLILTINDVLPAIEGRNEFIHAQKDWYDVVNYVISSPETFRDPEEDGVSPEEKHFRIIRRELRGIKFDKQGRILVRPHHKFFNLNEKEETQLHKINFKRPHVMLDKLDGSMITPIFNANQNGFRFGTKMGITDVAMQCEVYVASNPKYWTFVRDMHDDDLTPIFEWTSPRNRIVVNYPNEQLTITAIRETITGRYLSYDKMENLSVKYDIPLVKYIVNSLSMEDFLEKIKTMSGIEGFIVRFDDGEMLKIKIPEYVLMHHSKDLVSSNRRVFELILNEQIDDIKPQLFVEDIARVEDLEHLMSMKLIDLEHALYRLSDLYCALDRKTFAIEHKDKVSVFERSSVFRMMDGTLPMDIAKDYFKSKVTSDTNYQTLVANFGFPS